MIRRDAPRHVADDEELPALNSADRIYHRQLRLEAFRRRQARRRRLLAVGVGLATVGATVLIAFVVVSLAGGSTTVKVVKVIVHTSSPPTSKSAVTSINIEPTRSRTPTTHTSPSRQDRSAASPTVLGPLTPGSTAAFAGLQRSLPGEVGVAILPVGSRAR